MPLRAAIRPWFRFQRSGAKFRGFSSFSKEKIDWKTLSTLTLAAIALSGCASMGPATVARDRFDYIAAISACACRSNLV
jgi:hypothetical protein